MELLKTNHCCCCIDLRTGGLILGYLLAFSGIYGIFSGLMNGPAYILPNCTYRLSQFPYCDLILKFISFP